MIRKVKTKWESWYGSNTYHYDEGCRACRAVAPGCPTCQPRLTVCHHHSPYCVYHYCAYHCGGVSCRHCGGDGCASVGQPGLVCNRGEGEKVWLGFCYFLWFSWDNKNIEIFRMSGRPGLPRSKWQEKNLEGSRDDWHGSWKRRKLLNSYMVTWVGHS